MQSWWQKHDLDFLREHAESFTTHELAARLECTPDDVRILCRAVGVVPRDPSGVGAPRSVRILRGALARLRSK